MSEWNTDVKAAPAWVWLETKYSPDGPISERFRDAKGEWRGTVRDESHPDGPPTYWRPLTPDEEVEATAAYVSRDEIERANYTAACDQASREADASGWKESNPKDGVGITKVPYSTIPTPVLAELGVAMLEGALKYGRHNYRIAGVRASVYYDAVVSRHMAAWWEGEDDDPDSGLSHLTKAMAGLAVIRDAMIQGKMIDDRPPRSPTGWLARLNDKVKALLVKYPEPVAPYLAGGSRGPGRIL